MTVVYLDHGLDAAHAKHLSKNAFSMFSEPSTSVLVFALERWSKPIFAQICINVHAFLPFTAF